MSPELFALEPMTIDPDRLLIVRLPTVVVDERDTSLYGLKTGTQKHTSEEGQNRWGRFVVVVSQVPLMFPFPLDEACRVVAGMFTQTN